ncbi:hypothetical protein, partial [Vulcanisaeta distributa]|uniref:hypothetical protein n=1 Tax=Vulcanisaeta distributa TaxID=164451 RepID=UPI001FB20820
MKVRDMHGGGRGGKTRSTPDDAVGGFNPTVDEFKPRWLGGVPGGGAIRREEGEQPKPQGRVDAERGG